MAKGVAPHAGAWIEIPLGTNPIIPASLSLPTRGRGLKFLYKKILPFSLGRSPRGGVD